ncbi:globin family protein [Enterovibrio nigricans]|uniref:Nitric oxide dioxygenase n=1 Tax=Enterovibrio nigricans DSM 22720 TaxID=1121868 RepID=A0A1T4VVB2_9GAMM|nr:globin family protein [Enterovibrio nigricans]PKF49101.1 hemin receptor [Enterovibrio nigricans]SKA68441.1 nitric oxide dioxygenase [Enterovibrio nigricans DSM 22720]
MSLTPKQITLITSSFKKVEPISLKAAEIFYDTLFSYDPTLKPLFKGDMKQQGRKLMAMIHAAVNSLDSPENLAPVLKQLAQRHVSYGVKTTHFTPVCNALLHTLKIGLGDEFTPEVRDAWSTMLHFVSDVMKAEMAA